MLRKGEVRKIEITPDEKKPDERLWDEGKIKVLFDRVKKRRKAKFSATTKTRDLMEKVPADFNLKDLKPEYGRLEEDCIGIYLKGNKTAYIVRYAHEKYGVEIFDGEKSIANYYLEEPRLLLEEIIKDVSAGETEIKTTPGLSKKESKECQATT